MPVLLVDNRKVVSGSFDIVILRFLSISSLDSSSSDVYRMDSSSSVSCCNSWTVRCPLAAVFVSGAVRRPLKAKSSLIVASSSAVDL